MIFLIKMAGTGGHGNMITGLKLNYYTLRTLPKESKLSYKIIIKTFDDKNDPEIKFYKLANRLGKDQPQFDDDGNQIDTIKADPVFQELLKWMPEYLGVFDIDNLKEKLDEKSYNKVKAMKDVPKAFLIIEDITYKDSINKIDLKMGTRRFDSSAIAKHLKCEEHEDKGKTKLQTQTDKRDKNKMIKKWGVNIVAGKAPWVKKCLNKSDEFITCIMGGKDYKEKTYEDVKNSLLDIFLPPPNDKINLINILKYKLEDIKEMFEEVLSIHGLHFFSSSLFITLDKDRTMMKIRMIDFAHVEVKCKYIKVNGNDYFTGLPTFTKELEANKECNVCKDKVCKGKTPNLIDNEDLKYDDGYIEGLETLLKMIEEKKKELSDQPAQLPSERSRDGYKIKF